MRTDFLLLLSKYATQTPSHVKFDIFESPLTASRILGSPVTGSSAVALTVYLEQTAQSHHRERGRENQMQ